MTASTSTQQPPSILTSRAEVVTDVPARYAKQLVSHLGRKVEFVQDGDTWTAHVAGSIARITIGDGVLVLQADAPDVDGLARLEGALGNHLERFGQRRELTVTWQRSTPPSA
jgi:hypothetical protein